MSHSYYSSVKWNWRGVESYLRILRRRSQPVVPYDGRILDKSRRIADYCATYLHGTAAT